MAVCGNGCFIAIRRRAMTGWMAGGQTEREIINGIPTVACCVVVWPVLISIYTYNMFLF